MDQVLSTSIPLGHSKLTWHHTNKQMAFEFMADDVVITQEAKVRRQNLDPFFLQQLLGREPTEGEKVIEIKYTTGATLDCSFVNPDYGHRLSMRFIRRLTKHWQPQQLLLVPNYGLAPKKESFLFWRACPALVTPKQIVFYLLPTEGTGEIMRSGL